MRRLLSPREDSVDFVKGVAPTPSKQTGVHSSDDQGVPLDLDNDSSQILRQLRERLQRYDALPLPERLLLKPPSVSENDHDKERR